MKNHSAINAAQYYLRSIYVPLLDSILSDLINGIPINTIERFNLRLLLPSMIVTLNEVDGWDKQKLLEKITTLAVKFSSIFSVSKNVMVELFKGVYSFCYLSI